jgi:hypothetical protein
VHAAGQPLQAVKKALKAPRGRLLCYKILHRLLADLALVPAGGSCRLEGPCFQASQSAEAASSALTRGGRFQVG